MVCTKTVQEKQGTTQSAVEYQNDSQSVRGCIVPLPIAILFHKRNRSQSMGNFFRNEKTNESWLICGEYLIEQARWVCVLSRLLWVAFRLSLRWGSSWCTYLMLRSENWINFLPHWYSSMSVRNRVVTPRCPTCWLGHTSVNVNMTWTERCLWVFERLWLLPW